MTKLFAIAIVLLSATLVAAQPGAGTDFPPSFKLVTNVDQKKGQVLLDTATNPCRAGVACRRQLQGREGHGNALPNGY